MRCIHLLPIFECVDTCLFGVHIYVEERLGSWCLPLSVATSQSFEAECLFGPGAHVFWSRLETSKSWRCSCLHFSRVGIIVCLAFWLVIWVQRSDPQPPELCSKCCCHQAISPVSAVPFLQSLSVSFPNSTIIEIAFGSGDFPKWNSKIF